MKPLKKIAITTGDKNGVGFEVSAKALKNVTPDFTKTGVIFFIFRHVNQIKTQKYLFNLIDKSWRRLTFSSAGEALLYFQNNQHLIKKNTLFDIALNTNEAEWVLTASLACKEKLFDSLVTGPLSKKVSSALSGKPLGHTGIFRMLYPKNPLFMGFIGNQFNVLLVTDHMALNSVEKKLNSALLNSAFSAAKQMKAMLGSKKKIAVLGLNPHSGEQGLIGSFEKRAFKKLSSDFFGPIPPDAAFLKSNFTKYSLFLCMYHDQGLIPFKLVHGQDSGVHVTIGLPFVRTSVDHGTAFDIFNKNIANCSSMLDAINVNMKLIGA